MNPLLVPGLLYGLGVAAHTVQKWAGWKHANPKRGWLSYFPAHSALLVRSLMPHVAIISAWLGGEAAGVLPPVSSLIAPFVGYIGDSAGKTLLLARDGRKRNGGA